jgi:proteic killer suppression protein
MRRMAIRSFADQASEDVNYGRRTKRALRLLPAKLHEKARIKLARLHAAESLMDLASLPGSRLEKLHGDRAGQYSIRVNDQYRICFKWENHAEGRVEIVDYH